VKKPLALSEKERKRAARRLLALFRVSQCPAWHDTVLRGWAKRHGIDVERAAGYAGWSFYVGAGPMAFVVEHRGPGFPPFRHEWPFENVPRWHPNSRREAFARARAVFERLTGRAATPRSQ
jgi:hypothetical protein